MSAAEPGPSHPTERTVTQALEEILQTEGPPLRDSNSPFDGLALRKTEEALAYADELLSRDAADALSDLPRRFLLGFNVTARYPPINAEEAGKIWRMLQRMVHLEHLVLEDPDGLMLILPPDTFDTAPLPLAKLKYLKYCMAFSVEFCHKFLDCLQGAQLETLIVSYPEEYEKTTEQESSDLVALLAKPCADQSVHTLEVERMRYEYFDFSVKARLPHLRTLTLSFALDEVDPRVPIVAHLLHSFPNLASLDIATSAALKTRDPRQHPPLSEIREQNRTAQAGFRRHWCLDRLAGSALDLWILGLRCSVDVVDITQVDLDTVQCTRSLMHALFSENTPTALFVHFRDDASVLPSIITMFLDVMGECWQAEPFAAVPKSFQLDVRMKDLSRLDMLLASALALVPNSLRLEYYKFAIHFRCRGRHEGGEDDMEVDDDDDSEASSYSPPPGLTPCTAAQEVFTQMLSSLYGYEPTLQAASERGLHLQIKFSSYCNPDGHWWLYTRESARHERVVDWLYTSAS